jgi:hypothetical protein
MQSPMHPSKLKSSQLPHYSRSLPFSKGNVVSLEEICAPHKETQLLFDINYSLKLDFFLITYILNSTMHFFCNKVYNEQNS